jgi:hypothetical protein
MALQIAKERRAVIECRRRLSYYKALYKPYIQHLTAVYIANRPICKQFRVAKLAITK